MPKITISFKHNKEDLELYNEIMRHSDKSAYVKDILKDCATKEKDNPLLNQLKDFNFS